MSWKDFNVDDLSEDTYPTLDDTEVDALSDEEATLYFDDPVAFFKTRLGASQDDPEPTVDQPESDETKTDEEQKVANPYREQGIPDHLLVDDDTGEPYENGLILGKYESAEEYHRGMREAQKLVGRKTVEVPQSPVGSIPVQLTPDQMQVVDSAALNEALGAHANDFRREGLDPRDYEQDFESLKDISAELYYEVRRTRRELLARNLDFAQKYLYTDAHRPDINEQRAEQGYELFESAFIDATEGVLPDDGDKEVLREKYSAVLNSVLENDAHIQQYRTANPNADVFASPEIREFYATYYDQVDGVLVISPQKVAQAAVGANRALLYKAVRKVAEDRIASKYQQSLERNSDVAPRPDRTATTISSDGVTGAHRPVWPVEELYRPDAFDRLVKEHNGDEVAAQREYDRMIDYHDGQRAQRVVGDRRQF